MPMYEFQLVGGSDRVEKFYSADDAPEVGSRIRIGGRSYVRVFSLPQIDADVAARCRGYPYVSSALPDNLPGCDCTPAGKPIIRSRLHEKEICSRHGLKRD